MTSSSPAGDHDPLLWFDGAEGRAALDALIYSVDDSDGWLAMLRRRLDAGDVVVMYRNGDWLIFAT